MYCPKCGYKNDNQALFCAGCGSALQNINNTKVIDQRQIAAGTYAGFWRRLVAGVIDLIMGWVIIVIVGVIIYIIISLWGHLSGGTETELTEESKDIVFAISFVITWVLYWLYFALMEISPTQATPGKMALRIVVTDMEGRKISFRRATGRYFAKYVSTFLLLIGIIMIPFTEKKQGLHDILAQCLVVKK